MIIFSKLRYRNLLSTGNVFTEINLNSHNTTLIVGENGAGKSTILDALSFGLFGKPFRKVNKGQLINTINSKGMVVEVSFSMGNKNYFVQRGAKPNLFNIYSDGVLVNNNANSADYQEEFEKHILKINHKTFSQIVVLGSASFVPFMQMSAANRRDVIEDLLDIQIFSKMNLLLKDKIATNKAICVETDYAVLGLKEKIELEEKHLLTLQTNNDDQINIKKAKIVEHEASIAEAEKDIAQYENKLKAYVNLDQQHQLVLNKQMKLNSLFIQLTNKTNDLNKDITFFSTHNDCPVCQQGIGDQLKNDTIHDKQKKQHDIASAMVELQYKIDATNNTIKEWHQISRERDRWQNLIKDRNNDIVLCQRMIGGVIADIRQLEKTQHIEDNTNRLAEMYAQSKIKCEYGEQLGKQKKTLESAAVLLKDTGIKTKIIRQYIPVINKLINKYLASMDFFVNFELDENFEEKIKSRFRDEFSYSSFSEGEKARLDLALLCAWRSISRLRNSASTNLLILDEVFDGSLDARGSEELIKILQELTGKSNVFVISHKTDSYHDKFDRVLRFEKQKNFSNVVEL